MTDIEQNKWNTADLVISVMYRVARIVKVDITDNDVADKLYWICCRLEDWDSDHGFGSSDHYTYVQEARKEFGITVAA